MYVYSYSCLLELTGNLGWTSTIEPPAFEAPVLMAHNTLNGNMPHSTSLVPSLALLSLRSWTFTGKRYADMFTCTHSNNQHTDTHAHTHTPTKSCYPIKEGTWKTEVLAVGKIKILKTEILQHLSKDKNCLEMACVQERRDTDTGWERWSYAVVARWLHEQCIQSDTVLTLHYAPFINKPPLTICMKLLRRYIYLQFTPPSASATLTNERKVRTTLENCTESTQ